MNTQFEELIAKHLQGVLREDEKQLLAMMMKVPENQLYLASKIDEQFFDQPVEEVGDETIGNQIFHGIQQRLKEVKPQEQHIQQPAEIIKIAWHKRKVFRSIAVAASVILVIGLGIVFFANKKPGEQVIADQKNNKSADSIAFAVHREVNTTGKEERISLPDGSLIVLADKSEITYRAPFTDKRDIILIGKAYFKVAKDKTKPFTVFSGAISTTALGTEFTVTAFANNNNITVRLYEGKVVVKAVDKANKRMKENVYLLPGQQFVYNIQSTRKVKGLKLKKNTSPEQIMNEEQSVDNPSLPQDTQGSWYMFNNQSLGQVFDQLAKMYQVNIVYEKQDVENIYFTRKYKSSDSIEYILTEIATLNNLTVNTKDNTFIISK